MKRNFYPAFAIAITLASGLVEGAATTPESVQPEKGYGIENKTATRATDFMIVAAHPDAARIGYDILTRGGAAMDAAVAVQLTLNLVEPQSSGIGGGAFLVYWDAEARQLHTLDGRETAPASISTGHFLDDNGKPEPWWDRVVGGGSVGVPGTLKLLETAHLQFGKLDWPTLLQPAQDLAQNGFTVSPRMANSIRSAADKGLRKFAASRNYFFDADGVPLAAGTVTRNPEFARTLELIARHGSRVFYEGEIAADLVDTVNRSAPGSISLDDLRNYKVISRPPVCAPYRKYRVCGMGPPSSGALTLGQVLGMLQDYEFSGAGFTAEHVHLLSESQKLAYADRALYMADSDFVPVPVNGLLDAAYLQDRALLIDSNKAMEKARAGNPPRLMASARLATVNSTEAPGTSHISIVDRYGNFLSMTTTIETGFGSRLMTGGFLLNNELTDFSAIADIDGIAVANRIQPGKRPRSSMAPTIVFDARGNPILAAGSPGGSRIINYVAKTIVGILDLGLTAQQAVSTPNFSNRNGATELEADTTAVNWADQLQVMGHTIRSVNMNSGIHVIHLDTDGVLHGGVDPRREGVALGN